MCVLNNVQYSFVLTYYMGISGVCGIYIIIYIIANLLYFMCSIYNVYCKSKSKGKPILCHLED